MRATKAAAARVKRIYGARRPGSASGRNGKRLARSCERSGGRRSCGSKIPLSAAPPRFWIHCDSVTAGPSQAGQGTARHALIHGLTGGHFTLRPPRPLLLFGLGWPDLAWLWAVLCAPRGRCQKAKPSLSLAPAAPGRGARGYSGALGEMAWPGRDAGMRIGPARASLSGPGTCLKVLEIAGVARAQAKPGVARPASLRGSAHPVPSRRLGYRVT